MLYLIRHGKTDWNEVYKLQGRTDIPLNESGRQMALAANREYRKKQFDVVFCSPLVRAKETAELLLQGRNLPIHFDERLVEISFGNYEGIERISQKPEHPIYKFFHDPSNYVADNGAESFESLFARTGSFLKEEVDPLLAEGKNVLIVGHGAMNSSIISQKRGYSLDDFWKEGIENCKLKEI